MRFINKGEYIINITGLFWALVEVWGGYNIIQKVLLAIATPLLFLVVLVGLTPKDNEEDI